MLNQRSARRAWWLPLIVAWPLAVFAQADGPYVLRTAGNAFEAWSVAADGTKRVQPLAAGATIPVAAVGEVPAFRVKLRPNAADVPDSIELRAGTPLMAVADTHGEYEILARHLIAHRVVDSRLRWSFGRGHLVILGDVFDRGEHQLEILWLLYALEPQARRAGGGVHLVLGNHEWMALSGDLRYLHPRYQSTANALGVMSYSRLFDRDSMLGQWLRSKAAVMRIGENLCVHGGISPELLSRELGLPAINGAIRAVLNRSPFDPELARFLFAGAGPLWYRGYFPGQQEFTPATDADVERTLGFYGARRILIGHTIVPEVKSLYGGRVIDVQVYPKREPSGRTVFESLLIRDGKLLRALADGTTAPLQRN